MHAAAAFENATALQLQQDLFEVFQRNVMAFRDVVNSHDFRILHGEMQDGLGGVLAFGGDSHKGYPELAFHRRDAGVNRTPALCSGIQDNGLRLRRNACSV